MNQYLDCALSPLQRGTTLVEASAGTGKTYAIAMLVLRAVCEQKVPINSILVVTFTRAATEELRSRIRQRLVEARDALGSGHSDDNDTTMATWLSTVTDRDGYVKRLNEALLDIDRAGIFTIHSFCQRMLQEQALECGQLFDVELQGDIDDIVGQISADFWRSRVYRMDAFVCGAVSTRYSEPSQLLASIRGAGSVYDEVEPDLESVEELGERLTHHYTRLCSWYLEFGGSTREAFIRAMEEKQFKGGLNSEEKITAIWEEIGRYLSGATLTPSEHVSYLSVEGILPDVAAKALKTEESRQQLLDRLSLPDEDASGFLAAWRSILIALRRELIDYLRVELDSRMREKGILSYDDLIRRLESALREDPGPLRQVLAARYQAAFIDEFQDTDSGQWTIFETVFGGGEHFLYLIGDPKQAIYKFRGADIYSYFAARSAAGHLLTLRQNHRSHPELVESINRLFSLRSDSFTYEPKLLPFHPVEPARTPEDGELLRGGMPMGVLACWQLAKNPQRKKWYPGRAEERLIIETVGEILSLLDPADPVLYRKVEKGQDSSRSLQPSDIAILVRSHKQAEAYLQACGEVGLPAVVSSRKSVFATPEARELYRLLSSLAEPGNLLRLKSAMTIPWFGMTGDELDGIWSNDAVMDSWMERFLLYGRMWRENGFLVMMSNLLEEEEVLLKLSLRKFGERRIANILHLVELVQELETEEKLGPVRTLLRLELLISGVGAGEEAEMRLESDEQAVKIITMHGSKGLQYPVVFCPFLWHRYAMLEGEQELVRCHEDGQLTVDLGSPRFGERRESALAEELAEELRLLYVALTRAQLRCYMMLANCQKTGGSADTSRSSLAYLLWDGGEADQAEQETRFREFAESAGAEYRLLPAEDGEGLSTYDTRGGEQATPVPRKGTGRSLQTEYMMSSYSAMASLSEHEDHGADALTEEPEREEQGIRHPGLPAGANFGNVIHDCLEMIPFASVRRPEHEVSIARTCRRYGIDADAATVQALLADVVDTPLGSDGRDDFSLSGLRESKCLKEMPFYFHLNQLNTEAISHILAGDPAVVPLTAKSMKGYLTGFVDLVCEQGGRYYILDYKTNYLGEHLDDYQSDKLLQAMASHNYGLQYWIYTLVLHRYLSNVLEGYEYATCFGGVKYLFVRGMVPELPGSGVFSCRPDEATLKRLDRLLEGSDDD